VTTEQAENWDSPQNILVILAHPDDPEFFCGATLAKWARAGHHITYQLLTCGDKGFNESTPSEMTPDALCAIRHEEQIAAAKVIGVDAVHFMAQPDGYLIPDMNTRREIVRVIRKFKPDILVTCDPQTLFATHGINHPDHRAAGQVVLDAVFPAAGSPVFFPELLKEGYSPHMPKEVWCSLTNESNVVIDVTNTWQDKLDAILKHKSQIADEAKFLDRMKSRRTRDSTEENPRYEEKFRRIVYL